MTAPDLHARLEQAIGEPPPPGELPDPRVAGRRAVRRRRALAVSAVVVLVAVAGGATTLALGSSEDRGAVQVASDPTPTTAAATPTPTTPTPSAVFLPTVPVPGTDPAGEATTRLSDDVWADYRADGVLELLPDVTIVRRIDDPIAADVRSVALELSRPGKADQWYLVELVEDFPLPTITSTPVGEGWSSLEDWVDHLDQPLVDPPVFPSDDLVRRDATGMLFPTDGVRILDQRTGVDVGSRFSTAADTTAGLVTRGGTLWFVLVRSSYGTIDVISVPQSSVGATDLDGFIAYAREKYASGEGLR